MCKSGPVILFLNVIQLTVTNLLLLYLLTEKISLGEADQVILNSFPDNKFPWFI